MTKKLLDLFSGSGSVTKLSKKLGYDVKSLDIAQLKEAPSLTFKTDILNFNPETELARWVPDIIWASPPCTEYSHAKTRAPRDIEGANKLVVKSINIIKCALKKNPKLIWIIENPQTGLLKHQRFMINLPFVDADYCAYGLPYRKRTRFWTNVQAKTKMCPGPGKCPFIKPGTTKHIHNIGNGQARYNFDGRQFLTREKYKIPEKLLRLFIA
jgi:site-specific DNA-cytosine methylase